MKEKRNEVNENKQPANGPETYHWDGSLPVSGGEQEHKATDNGDV